MANIMPESRPGVSPKIMGVDDGAERLAVKGDDLVKERSGLADMLYLRCKWCQNPRIQMLIGIGLDGLKLKWPGV